MKNVVRLSGKLIAGRGRERERVPPSSSVGHVCGAFRDQRKVEDLENRRITKTNTNG